MPIDPQKLSAARRLYLQYRGRHHRLIQSEMHDLGFPTFTRRVFYSSKRTGQGWPTRFGWKDELDLTPQSARRNRMTLSSSGSKPSPPA